MKFAVIGAGFYGLHIASRLRALGLETKVFDKAHDILSFASGNNQFRLHWGFIMHATFALGSNQEMGTFGSWSVTANSPRRLKTITI
jgi:2-polyprenyl-6-methoxyphenol hydroxylase-like FAD-dependent oxidoreductase